MNMHTLLSIHSRIQLGQKSFPGNKVSLIFFLLRRVTLKTIDPYDLIPPKTNPECVNQPTNQEKEQMGNGYEYPSCA